MIRIEIALRFALFLGLIMPVIARAQDPRPAAPSTPTRKESTAPEVATTPPGQTSTVNRSIVIDPTAAPGPDEVDDPEAKTPPRNRNRTIIRTDPKATSATQVYKRFQPYFDHYAAYQPAPARMNAQASPGPFDPLQARFGLILAPVDEVLRSQLEIPKGQGVVVVEVGPRGLAEHAGLKPKDVLLSLGDMVVSGVGQAKDILLGLGKEAIEVKLIREGKPRRMSLVGPDHGFTPESSEFWIGVPVSPVDPVLRSHLTELPAEAGLIANDVVKESPADKAGVKKNDILVSMGGKPLKSADTLIAQVQASGGKAVPLVVLRAGKPTTMDVTPTKRAHPTVISLNPGHQQRVFQFVQPNVAIEVHKRLQDVLSAHSQGGTVGKPGEEGKDIEIELFTNKIPLLNDDGDARIAAQLKELTTKIDDLRKAIEAVKKPEAK